jgi:hypothetical protein
MTTNEFVELQMVILVASCALMLAVFSVESGGLLMRAVIFGAALINAVAALIFINKERKRLRSRDMTEAQPHKS